MRRAARTAQPATRKRATPPAVSPVLVVADAVLDWCAAIHEPATYDRCRTAALVMRRQKRIRDTPPIPGVWSLVCRLADSRGVDLHRSEAAPLDTDLIDLDTL